MHGLHTLQIVSLLPEFRVMAVNRLKQSLVPLASFMPVTDSEQ